MELAGAVATFAGVAVVVYFWARGLGVATIEATGRTYALESAVRQAAEDNRYFFGAALSL